MSMQTNQTPQGLNQSRPHGFLSPLVPEIPWIHRGNELEEVANVMTVAHEVMRFDQAGMTKPRQEPELVDQWLALRGTGRHLQGSYAAGPPITDTI
jgi:hypothetical protein